MASATMEKPAKPSRAAVKAYQESVFSGQCDDAVLVVVRFRIGLVSKIDTCNIKP